MRHDIVHDSRYLKFNVIFLIIALLTTFMFIDTFLIKFYDIVKKNFITLDEKKILFGIVTSACLILELVIFQYMKKLIKKTKVNIKLNMGSIDKMVYIAQFSIMIFIFILIIQIFYINFYLSYILMIIITIVFGTTAFLIGKIASVFISWYRIRNNRIFFIYALSLSLIIFNLVMTAIVLLNHNGKTRTNSTICWGQYGLKCREAFDISTYL